MAAMPVDAPIVRLGRIHAHAVTFVQALDAIESLVKTRSGGYVLTPNVDHVCLADTDEGLREAYANAALSLVDGMPLLWLARALGTPLPEKVSGSDLVMPLCERAAQRGMSVYLLGARPGVGAKAAQVLTDTYPGITIAGVDAPPLGFEQDPAQNEAVLARIRAAKPDLLFVALGCPKQELWLAKHSAAYGPAVGLGIGATIDFIAGEVRRSPRVLSRLGLEWLYRLAKEPRRLAHRYLVRDRAIVGIAWRMWRKRSS
jgi:N-acetylglucosaminyldiphosphoundecaprenol N-acetyl-beta-D-mannosaminyltransferase